MPIARPVTVVAALLSVLALASAAPRPAAAPSAAPLSWPDTEIARHARAWFEAYNAGEGAMRAVYRQHYSPEALADRPVDARLGAYREMREAQGALAPVAIGPITESTLQVTARTADGRTLRCEFECEAEAPHRIRGIRVMEGEGAPGGPGPGNAPAGPPRDDGAAVEAMRAIAARAAEADSFSGAVLLARDGKPLLRQAWNRAERRFAVPNRPETRFNLGSISKLFTKVAIAQLAQQGKLTLDDPLTRWLPD